MYAGNGVGVAWAWFAPVWAGWFWVVHGRDRRPLSFAHALSPSRVCTAGGRARQAHLRCGAAGGGGERRRCRLGGSGSRTRRQLAPACCGARAWSWRRPQGTLPNKRPPPSQLSSAEVLRPTAPAVTALVSQQGGARFESPAAPRAPGRRAAALTRTFQAPAAPTTPTNRSTPPAAAAPGADCAVGRGGGRRRGAGPAV